MKPLLSELFLPCSRMRSPIWANRYPLTTITGAQRASGQTHSRARSHQDDADLRADRSTAYLVSCFRVRSAHGNSFDHLVGGHEQRGRYLQSERLRSPEVDDELELGWLLDRKIARLFTSQDAIGVTRRLSEQFGEIDSVRYQTALGGRGAQGIDRGQTVTRRQLDDELAMRV